MKQHFVLVFHFLLIPAGLAASQQEFLNDLALHTYRCGLHNFEALQSMNNAFTTYEHKLLNHDIMNRIQKIRDGGVNADDQLCLDLQSTTNSGDDVLRAMAACSIDVKSLSYTFLKISIDIVKKEEPHVCPGIGVSPRNPSFMSFTTEATKIDGDKIEVRAVSLCQEQVMVNLVRCNYLDVKQMGNISQVIAQMNKKLGGMPTDCREHSEQVKCVLEQGRLLKNCSEDVQPSMSSKLKKLLDVPACDTDWIGRSSSPNYSANVNLLVYCLVISVSIACAQLM